MLPPTRRHYPRFLGPVHLLLFPSEQRAPYAEVLHMLSPIWPEKRDPVPTLSVFSGEVSIFQNPHPQATDPNASRARPVPNRSVKALGWGHKWFAQTSSLLLSTLWN